MTPTAGSTAHRYRPARLDARRQPASSPFWRRTRITTRASMTMPGCRTCCASPGMASHCMAAPCPATRPRTAACGCLTISLRRCSIRCRWGCGCSSRRATWSLLSFPLRRCSCPIERRSPLCRRRPWRSPAKRTRPPRRRPLRRPLSVRKTWGGRGSGDGAQARIFQEAR